MKPSIYEVYVNIEDQPQADRMKQICIDYGLPYWQWFYFGKNCIFTCDEHKDFFIMCSKENIKYYKKQKKQVTESEFLELVKMLF